MLRQLPDESLPHVLEVVRGLSQQSQRQTRARSDQPISGKKESGHVKLPADPEAAQAVLRDEVGFGMLPAPLALVQQVMEEDLYELD
jgi:hypothetical protein